MEIEMVRISEQIPLSVELLNSISQSRRERVDRFVGGDDKKRCLLAELLIQKYAKRLYNKRRNEYSIHASEYGKPYIPELPGFHFSISHSGLFVAIGVSEAPVGIDVETISPIDLNVAKRFFSEEEYAYIMEPRIIQERWIRFYEIWTLKESYVKALGIGMRRSFSSFSFRCGCSGIVCEDPEEINRFHFYSQLYAKSYCISVCHSDISIPNLAELREVEFYESWAAEGCHGIAGVG